MGSLTATSRSHPSFSSVIVSIATELSFASRTGSTSYSDTQQEGLGQAVHEEPERRGEGYLLHIPAELLLPGLGEISEGDARSVGREVGEKGGQDNYPAIKQPVLCLRILHGKCGNVKGMKGGMSRQRVLPRLAN